MKTDVAYLRYICIQKLSLTKDEKNKTFAFKQSNRMKLI